MRQLILFLISFLSVLDVSAQQPVPQRPRILISTDIGGTDSDDNQSMMHFLLYCNKFDVEGIVSSPSYGYGRKSEITRMIDLYEKDLPTLKKHETNWPTPDYLRSISKQGKMGAAPLAGYSYATEGSDWIIRCARKKSDRKLWLLVWGGLDDVAQALHDAPDIKDKVKIYWIGGPNKKWSINSYVYIVKNFPDLWFIEDNASYRGFIAKNKVEDEYNANFYEHFAKGAGHLGADFVNYLKGIPKMGDTPSLLYMMDSDPNDPTRGAWGGSFTKNDRSPLVVLDHVGTPKDSAQAYAIIEFRIKGPVRQDIKPGTPCIDLFIAKQHWEGYYLGEGNYVVKYSTYRYGTQPYTITSDIEGFKTQNGYIAITNDYPGKKRVTDYQLGTTWYTDRPDKALFWDDCQGAMTVYKWRHDVFNDWGKRLDWLKN